jgi:hypothetical protein
MRNQEQTFKLQTEIPRDCQTTLKYYTETHPPFIQIRQMRKKPNHNGMSTSLRKIWVVKARDIHSRSLRKFYHKWKRKGERRLW